MLEFLRLATFAEPRAARAEELAVTHAVQLADAMEMLGDLMERLGFLGASDAGDSDHRGH
ncbi:MAG: hypothetical protein R3D02_03425 [Hyphomicrobiales bacterium]